MGSIAFYPLNCVASFFWAVATASARRFSKSRKRLPARVVSIGNIQVGGAGKTPLVAFLARQAHARGLQVCILSRGYGAEWETRGGVIAPGDGVLDAAECGDEALLLHELAPHAWIGIGADRARQFGSVSAAVQSQGQPKIDLVILDDGFQNHRLQKDLEIVALTSARWGQKIFRDFRGALKSASLLVWTKGEDRPQDYGRPMVRVLMDLPRSQFSESFLLITGLADGDHARRAAEQAGYRIAKHFRFPDHARYAPAVIDSMIQEARSQRLKIAMTGKDWVKWRPFVNGPLKESMFEILEPELRLDPSDEKIWNRVIWES